MDKLKQNQVQFHLNKIALLRKEYDAKKSAGEKKLWKEEQLLAGILQRIQIQIDQHEAQIKELQST